MNFEHFKRIWNDMDQRHMYAIDEKIIHRDIVRNNRQIRKRLNVFEWCMFLIVAGLALMMIIEGIWDEEYYQFAEAAILWVAAGYIFRDHKTRLRLQNRFGGSIKEKLEESIELIKYQAHRQRRFVWWFVLPMTVSVLIHAVFTYHGKPWWLWPLTAIAFIISYYLMIRESRKIWLPEKKRLESLLHMMNR